MYEITGIGPGCRNGHTLVELLTVVALIAIAAALAYPSARSLFDGEGLKGAAREMLMTLKLARWKAVVSGRRTRLATFRRRGDPGLWYITEKETDGVWIPEGDARRLSEELRMEVTGSSMKTFYPNGTSSFGSIILDGPGGESCRLSLNPVTGRVRLYRGGGGE